MAQESVQAIKKRREAAHQIKSYWRDLHADAYEYALPQRNLYKTGEDATSHPAGRHRATPGQKKTDRVFDSTAVSSTISFANRIQSDLMPPFQRWATLKAGPMVPEEMQNEVNQRLEGVTSILFSVIHASNFDTAINEVLLDLAIGTGAMLILEGPTPDQPVMYIPVPMAKIMLEEGPWGTVSGVYRDLAPKVRHVKQQWPDADDVSQQKQEQAEKDPEVTVDLIEATYFDQEDEVWRYEVIETNRAAKTDEGKRIVAREFEVSPWVTPRWIKVSGEVYGRGPVIQALPDIKTLNKMVELVLKNASLHISGVYTGVNDGVLNPNTVRITPGAVIPVASNGGTRGPSLQPLERTGSFDLAQMEWEQLVMRIKEIMLDNRLPPESGAVRSATEIIERVKALVRDLGAPFGRLMTELIRPLVQRTLQILTKRNLIPVPVKVDGLAVEVQVMSQLAQAQNMNDVETVVRWLSLLASFGQEQLMLSAKVEDAGPWIGEKLGVPSDLIRGKEERKAMQQMGGQLLAQQQGLAPAPASSGQVAQAPLATVGAQAA